MKNEWRHCRFSFFVFFVLVLVIGLAGLMCCETPFCDAHRHNDVEGHSNISSTIYSFIILCLEPHYCGARQSCSLTEKLNPQSAFVYFRWFWSWFCYFGLKNLVLFTSLVSTA